LRLGACLGSTLGRLEERGLALWRTPLGKVLAAALLLRLTGLVWGLPSYDGWDNDGVAPRDFLVGVLETYWPGHHYTYPPLHLLLLTVAEAPVWLSAILRAPALTPAAVVHTFIGVPTMTAMAVVARAITAGLSLGLLWNLAEIGTLLRGSKRAGAWVAVACGLNAVATYYSQTTNLDLPYLFWSVLALRWLVHAIVGHAPRSLRRVIVLAALAVATKDQAYALFVLGVPLSLGAWLALDPDARPLLRSLLKELGVGVAFGLPLLLVVDGAVTNPSGFRDRVAYLLGPASQDFAYYPPTWAGRLTVATDALLSFDQFYPWAFALLAVVGIGIACRGPDRARRAAGLVPLLAALSFTVAFDMSARRSEHRFALPQMVLLGVYAGVALDALHARFGRWRPGRWAFAAGVAPVLLYALFKCVAVDVAMLFDPRYDAENSLREHARPGDAIEIYGSNVQLPRLPADAAIQRVDLDGVEGRNPILGVTEVSDRFSNVEARRPRFIIVPSVWAIRWIVEPSWGQSTGQVLSPGQARIEGDVDSRNYFHALFEGRLSYRMAHASVWKSAVWPQVDIHASLTREIWLFERTAQ
jgi:hypothetical protein